MIDGNKIALAAKHLTKIESFSLNLNNAKHDPLSYFCQFMCRKDVIDLLKEITSPKSRLDFCRCLPKIIDNAHRQFWDAMIEKAHKFTDVTNKFDEMLLKFYCHIQREKMMLSDDERQLIADAIQQDKNEIQIEAQQQHQVCNGCFQLMTSRKSTGRLEDCANCRKTAKRGKLMRKTFNTIAEVNYQTSCHSTIQQQLAVAMLTQSQFGCRVVLSRIAI